MVCLMLTAFATLISKPQFSELGALLVDKGRERDEKRAKQFYSSTRHCDKKRRDEGRSSASATAAPVVVAQQATTFAKAASWTRPRRAALR